jgi:hypothetical protein
VFGVAVASEQKFQALTPRGGLAPSSSRAIRSPLVIALV